MRPSAGHAVTPDPVIWAVLPPERRAAAVALLAMLAARAAARWREAVVMSLGRYRPQGQPQQKIRPGAPGPGGDRVCPPVEQAAGA